MPHSGQSTSAPDHAADPPPPLSGGALGGASAPARTASAAAAPPTRVRLIAAAEGARWHVDEALPAQRTLRVAVVDHHPLMLAGVRAALADDDRMALAGEARTAEGAVALVARTRPDVVLLDLCLPGGDGPPLVRRLRDAAPDAAVIALSPFGDDMHVREALALGADGYIVKSVDPRDLPAAIRQVVDGCVFVTCRVHRPLASGDGRRRRAETPITTREREILAQAAQGLSNRQIAVGLSVAEQTVKFHLSNVYRKLGVSNRTEASRSAQLRGLVPADEPAADA